MLQYFLPKGQRGLSPESVSCRAETNQKIEDGLWAGTGKGLREVSVCSVSVAVTEHR